MTTVSLSPPPILSFLNNAGQPAAGGSVLTQVGGVNHPTYQDSAGTIPLPNPIPLNSRGEISNASGTSCQLFLESGVVYTFTLYDSSGIQLNQATYTSSPNSSSQLSSTSGASLVGFIQAGTGAVARTVQDELRDMISVKQFGAKGDGVTDDAVAILAADVYAASVGKSLYFPNGVYMVDVVARGTMGPSAAYGLLMTTSWIGQSRKAIIRRKDFNTTTASWTVQAYNLTNVEFRNLTVDGQVTTVAAGTTPNVDLGALGAYSDTNTEALWSKPYGVIFRNCTGITVDNCLFTNFLRAGLRIAGDGLFSVSGKISSNVKISNCDTIRTRGIYGDGIIYLGVTDCKVTNTHVYDYQRIGHVKEYAEVDGLTNCRDIVFENCTCDLGHDNVATENNTAFWSEDGDNILYSNCVAKRTAMGWVLNVSNVAGDTGTTRPWISNHSLENCSAIKTRKCIYGYYGGTRSVHLKINNFTGEVNNSSSAASTNANSPKYANDNYWNSGISVYFGDTVAGTTFTADITNVELMMVDWGLTLPANTPFGALMFARGNVTNEKQYRVNVNNFQTKWLKTDGTTDTGAETLYQNSTAAHYGDIVVGGYHMVDGNDLRVRGLLTFNNVHNHSFGYSMVSTELLAGEIRFNNSRISLNTVLGNAAGNLYIENCPLVDFRSIGGFTNVMMSNSTLQDASVTTARSNDIVSLFSASNCVFKRQVRFNLNGGDATHRAFRLAFSGCSFVNSFNTESGLFLYMAAGTYAQVSMSGCSFVNVGTGAMAATAKMIEVSTTTGVVQFCGAGNAFDSAMVTAGGHVIQTNTTPTYNDVPHTVAGPWLTVAGELVIYNPI